MNKPLISFISVFLFLLGLCLPVGAEDVVWRPRTPAGGAATIDPDFYFQMADAAKEGSKSVQVSQTFDGSVYKRGFFEVADDGQVAYYDLSGEKVDLDRVAKIEDDPDRPPNGVVYYSAPRQVTTY
ncbi:MAG: hypothetical protein SWE60_26970 [Thermodesulfobacteriota bacterium]|nr:hypothetical protein [Thermodesulfobacteriota bacterium]